MFEGYEAHWAVNNRQTFSSTYKMNRVARLCVTCGHREGVKLEI